MSNPPSEADYQQAYYRYLKLLGYNPLLEYNTPNDLGRVDIYIPGLKLIEVKQFSSNDIKHALGQLLTYATDLFVPELEIYTYRVENFTLFDKLSTVCLYYGVVLVSDTELPLFEYSACALAQLVPVR